MKTAVSVPDELFRAAEQLAGRFGWSRSKLYAQALTEFLARSGADPVTAALDELADETEPAATPAVGRALIESGAWEW